MPTKFDGRVKRHKICNNYGWEYPDYKHHITSWYESGMSSHEIAEKIYLEAGVEINPRSIMRVVPCRNTGDAFRNAIERGRVQWAYKENKIKRKRLGVGVRMEVLRRDGFKCVLCGAGPKESILEVDHIVPVTKGGNDASENLRTLCYACNRGKAVVDKER